MAKGEPPVLKCEIGAIHASVPGGLASRMKLVDAEIDRLGIFDPGHESAR